MESRIEVSGRESLRSSSALEAWKRIEVSELYHSCSLITTPRFRLHALLSLIPTARQLDMRTAGMERDVTRCLEAIDRKLCDAARSMLLDYLGRESDVRFLQDLARSFFLPENVGPVHTTRCLLAAGKIDEARDYASELKDPVLRSRSRRLAETGIWMQGGRSLFVPPPFGESTFPDSLPRFIAMARSLNGADGEPARKAERLLSSFSGRDRQIALAHWAAARSRVSGLEAGRAVVRSIRYKSVRELARFFLLRGCLRSGRLDDAWRVLAEMRRGAHRERGLLLTAVALIRRGRTSRARRVLSEPFLPVRHRERAWVFAELHLAGEDFDRLVQTTDSLRAPPSTKWEDLSHFDATLPPLPHRCTLLALRDGLDHEDGESRPGLGRRNLLALAHDRRSVRRLLAEVAARDLDPRDCLRLLRRHAIGATDPVWSEYLTLRCSQLSSANRDRAAVPRSFSEAFLLGLRARSEAARSWPEATDVRRCAFDEGVSLSQDAEERRSALIRAAKASLKHWLQDQSAAPVGALRARLRSLMNLGRGLGSTQLERALAAAKTSGPVYRAAFSALAALEPLRAARLFFHHHVDMLAADPRTTASVLTDLEDHRVVEPAFKMLWMRLSERVRCSLGAERAGRWLEQLVSSCSGNVPNAVVMECVLEETSELVPGTVHRLIRKISKRLERAFRLSSENLLTTLFEDRRLLMNLIWLMPARLPKSTDPWSTVRWQWFFYRLRRYGGQTDVHMVRRLAKLMVPSKGAARLARRWLLGLFPIPDRSRVLEIPGGAGESHRLRYLEKRTDMLTFLRFADCVSCCFNSTSPWYRGNAMERWMRTLWKDPLSFCFHVEQRQQGGGDWSPCGFVFGGYGLVEEAPALLVNGIYLRKQHRKLRFAILEAIEKTYCRPLGIRWIAIAVEHGGKGALPKAYLNRPFAFHRFRALRTDRGPVRRIYDDLTYRVNETVCERHLFWKML